MKCLCSRSWMEKLLKVDIGKLRPKVLVACVFLGTEALLSFAVRFSASQKTLERKEKDEVERPFKDVARGQRMISEVV